MLVQDLSDLLLNKCSVPTNKQDLAAYLWRKDIVLDSHPSKPSILLAAHACSHAC